MFRHRLPLWLIAGLILSVFLLLSVFLVRDQGAGERALAQEREAAAHAAALTVEEFIRGNLRTLKSVAAGLQVTEDRELTTTAERLRRVLESNEGWISISIHGPDGVNLVTVTVKEDALAGTTDISDRAYFQAVMATGEPVVSSAMIGRVTGEPVVVVATPLALADGERGVLLASIPTERLAADLTSAFGTPTMRVVLIDGDRQRFVHPDPTRVEALEQLEGAPEAEAALAGESGSGIFDVRGERTLIAYAPVATAGWAVRLAEPTASAFAPVERQLYERLGGLTVALLVLGSVGGFLGNRLSRSHEARAYALAAEQQARGRAEEAVRARDEFLGIAAHELRNPVAGLKGTAQLLERSLSQGRLDEERLRGCVESLVETSSRLARLVDDLLDVSRLEHGRLAVRPEPVDLPSLVREIVSEHLDDGARTHPVRLTGETTLIVPVDPERFRDLLNNLLSNAEKYSEDSAEIVVSLEREDSTVAVTVADGGMGIPREALGTIFEPFGRASNAERANIPGLGLGLYLSRHIAEAHGGNLEATSEGEGCGSAFTFRLPCPAEGQ